MFAASGSTREAKAEVCIEAQSEHTAHPFSLRQMDIHKAAHLVSKSLEHKGFNKAIGVCVTWWGQEFRGDACAREDQTSGNTWEGWDNGTCSKAEIR